jgi:3-hydroxyisobutyrate dehydrogenase-like beta-hydroxyacid dehydrogenase
MQTADNATMPQGVLPSRNREKLGLIGVGLLGSALAERLLRGGFRLCGFDLHPGRRDSLRALGGAAAEEVAEVVRGCGRILLSLPDSEVVWDTLQRIEAELRAGQVFIDTTTGAPNDAMRTGRWLAAHGVGYLDAAVCGNSDELRRGEVLVVAGGPAATHAECRDVFGAFARQSWHLGDWGAGLKMKLTTNLVLGLNRAALAEGLAFAEAQGLDSGMVLRVLRASSSYSRVMYLKGDKMVGGDFTPQARLSQHLKDVRLMLAAGAEAGARLPLSERHGHLLAQAEAAGWGELDNSAIIRVFRRG